jgi:hypothetical protein
MEIQAVKIRICEKIIRTEQQLCGKGGKGMGIKKGCLVGDNLFITFTVSIF